MKPLMKKQMIDKFFQFAQLDLKELTANELTGWKAILCSSGMPGCSNWQFAEEEGDQLFDLGVINPVELQVHILASIRSMLDGRAPGLDPKGDLSISPVLNSNGEIVNFGKVLGTGGLLFKFYSLLDGEKISDVGTCEACGNYFFRVTTRPRKFCTNVCGTRWTTRNRREAARKRAKRNYRKKVLGS